MPVVARPYSLQYTTHFVLQGCRWDSSRLLEIPRREEKRRQCMSVKASSHSRIKTIKVTCDRCKRIVEGIRGEKLTAGFYDMTKWEEYRRENERYVCASCMFADPIRRALRLLLLGVDIVTP